MLCKYFHHNLYTIPEGEEKGKRGKGMGEGKGEGEGGGRGRGRGRGDRGEEGSANKSLIIEDSYPDFLIVLGDLGNNACECDTTATSSDCDIIAFTILHIIIMRFEYHDMMILLPLM